MMTENADGLGISRGNSPAGMAERSHELAQRRFLAYETARSLPVDEVDMRVDLAQAANGVGTLARSEGRNAGEADFRQSRHQGDRDAVPGRDHHRQCPFAEQP